MTARGAPPRASVPGRVCGPVLARPVPARSLRGALWPFLAAAVPCASAGRGAGAVQTQPTRAALWGGQGLFGRDISARGYWQHV